MKKIFSIGVITGIIATFLTGENAMAENLTTEQKSVAEVSAYTASGNQTGLKEALIKGLDAGVTVN
ncbi:MAG: hypothetical protein IKO06_04920, partial [Alphaproteobacteria bacterium]|nr:hypothetical protein [Alphaproteobacteria bacterium]